MNKSLNRKPGPKGKLWYDDDPEHSLERKIRDACKIYRRAFKEKPNVAHVHPSVVDEVMVIRSVTVVPHVSCLRHHYFVFREDMND